MSLYLSIFFSKSNLLAQSTQRRNCVSERLTTTHTSEPVTPQRHVVLTCRRHRRLRLSHFHSMNNSNHISPIAGSHREWWHHDYLLKRIIGIHWPEQTKCWRAIVHCGTNRTFFVQAFAALERTSSLSSSREHSHSVHIVRATSIHTISHPAK